MIANEKISANEMLERYTKAADLVREASIPSKVLNGSPKPQWIGESDCFWYIKQLRKADGKVPGTEYRLVNAAANTNALAFDHKALAKALAKTTGETVSNDALPIVNLNFDQTDKAVTFEAFDKRWRFDGALKKVKKTSVNPNNWVLSPDGKQAVYLKDFNLWVRDLKTGHERALTTDGVLYNAYGTQPEARDLLMGKTSPQPQYAPEVLWSPDGKHVFTVQTDEREVRLIPSMIYVPQDGTVAPQVVERKYGMPGDKDIVEYRFLVINVESSEQLKFDHPKVEDSYGWFGPFTGNRAWWSADSRTVYFVDMSRGMKVAKLMAVDIDTGENNLVFEDSSDTYLEPSLNFEHPDFTIHFAQSDEILWFSERSGWAHFYLYDLKTGALKRPITKGDWMVRNVVHVDEQAREIWLEIVGRIEGRNPYYREIVRVDIDGGEMTILASGDYDYLTHHNVGRDDGVAPSRNYFVTTRCRVDELPMTELRDRNGKIISIVETVDAEGLPSTWQWPQSHCLKVADGETDVWAVTFRPSNFDTTKKYPVLDVGYAAPFTLSLPTGAFVEGVGDTTVANGCFLNFASVAELGFIVVVMDGRGTPHRSKAFHNVDYGELMQPEGTADHVTAIQQLGEQYAYMDMDRVGAFGPDSPSNITAHGMLQHPDFYKVGVAFTIWDPRLVKQGEIFHGLIDKSASERSYWAQHADKLDGKLLLITGMRDAYFHSSMTFQLADALIKANKSVDMILHPNGAHAWRVRNSLCRAWDYLVRHLLDQEPPKNFELPASWEAGWPEQLTELKAPQLD